MTKQPRIPNVFDASFRYRTSFETDIRLTFKRIRKELAAETEQYPRRLAGSDGRLSLIVKEVLPPEGEAAVAFPAARATR